jgi:hypothetical protein
LVQSKYKEESPYKPEQNTLPVSLLKEEEESSLATQLHASLCLNLANMTMSSIF